MPHSIPVEASDTLAFTPLCLAHLAKPPVFHLRAATHRDQAYYRRIMREEALTRHNEASLRDVTRSELERLWSADVFGKEIERIEAYWQALDSFAEEVKENPELTFEYDPAEIIAINALSQRLRRASPTLSAMFADNAESAETSPVLLIAAVVQRIENLETAISLSGGYMSVDNAYAVRDALESIPDGKAGLAWTELMVACARRFRLIKDAEKNSVSPSPSEPAPASSNTATARGKSRKSAKSAAATSTA